MYVIATFSHSKDIEIALADLQNDGLETSNILVLPLDNKTSSLQLLDSTNQYDRESLFDIAAILGMIFMLLGSIYGFLLKWGPVLWGVIGLIIGLLVGLAIKFIYLKNQEKSAVNGNQIQAQIVVIVNCQEYQRDKVKQILWSNTASGLTTFAQGHTTKG